MKSNYQSRLAERDRPRVDMRRYEARVMVDELVQDAYRREENKKLADFAEALILAEECFLLAAYRVYGYAEIRGYRLWKEAFELREEARTSLRAGGHYEDAGMGQNVEDYAIQEELRKIGINVRKWLEGAEMVHREDGRCELVCPNAPGKEARHESKEA